MADYPPFAIREPDGRYMIGTGGKISKHRLTAEQVKEVGFAPTESIAPEAFQLSSSSSLSYLLATHAAPLDDFTDEELQGYALGLVALMWFNSEDLEEVGLRRFVRAFRADLRRVLPSVPMEMLRGLVRFDLDYVHFPAGTPACVVATWCRIAMVADSVRLQLLAAGAGSGLLKPRSAFHVSRSDSSAQSLADGIEEAGYQIVYPHHQALARLVSRLRHGFSASRAVRFQIDGLQDGPAPDVKPARKLGTVQTHPNCWRCVHAWGSAAAWLPSRYVALYQNRGEPVQQWVAIPAESLPDEGRLIRAEQTALRASLGDLCIHTDTTGKTTIVWQRR